jgi:hypothetical protein
MQQLREAAGYICDAGKRLRVFRQPAREPPEQIVPDRFPGSHPPSHGEFPRDAGKLHEFCFCFEDGFLRPLQQVVGQSEKRIAQSVTLPGQGGIRNGGK